MVAWLEALDSLDFSSFLELDRDIPDVLDFGLSSSLNLKLDDLVRLFFSSDRSVSGGLGGRSSFCAFFRVPGSPADLDLLRSLEPRSVGSGVRGSARRADPSTSS